MTRPWRVVLGSYRGWGNPRLLPQTTCSEIPQGRSSRQLVHKKTLSLVGLNTEKECIWCPDSEVELGLTL